MPSRVYATLNKNMSGAEGMFPTRYICFSGGAGEEEGWGGYCYSLSHITSLLFLSVFDAVVTGPGMIPKQETVFFIFLRA